MVLEVAQCGAQPGLDRREIGRIEGLAGSLALSQRGQPGPDARRRQVLDDSVVLMASGALAHFGDLQISTRAQARRKIRESCQWHK